MNETPSAEQVERIAKDFGGTDCGYMLRQYASLIRRLAGQKTGRVNALALSDVIVSESRLIGADRYAELKVLARTIEAELGLALEMERERIKRAVEAKQANHFYENGMLEDDTGAAVFRNELAEYYDEALGNVLDLIDALPNKEKS